MSRYKKLMIQRGVMQKAVAEKIHKTDPRVDTSLLSKFVNDVYFKNLDEMENFEIDSQSEPIETNGYIIRFVVYRNRKISEFPQ